MNLIIIKLCLVMCFLWKTLTRCPLWTCYKKEITFENKNLCDMCLTSLLLKLC